MACVDTSLQKCKGIRNLWNTMLCISLLNSQEKEAESGNIPRTGMRVYFFDHMRNGWCPSSRHLAKTGV